MVALLVVVLAVILTGWRYLRGRPWDSGSLLALALLSGGGLLLSAPFLTSQGTGSGEAFNYSLALADAVAQLREGQLPLIAGQTEYAFNGRIHPLRSAPYVAYFGGALDLVTFRQLTIVQLQNLALAISLNVLLLMTWGALRWATRVPPLDAVFLTFLLVASPAVLATSYSFDLYMTLHAAPYAVLALAAATRGWRVPDPRNEGVLAGALAATWWAHPPVALWCTALAVVLRLVVLARRLNLRSVATLGLATLAAGALSLFVGVSVLELTGAQRFERATPEQRAHLADLVWRELNLAFPACVLPVSASGTELGDLQLGYPLLFVLLAAAAAALSRRARPGRRAMAAATAGSALVLVVLCLPVPGLTHGLWSLLPRAVHELTNIWPMHRLYLLAGALTVLAASWVRPWRFLPHSWARYLGLGLIAWTCWQAYPFLRLGYTLRWSEDQTRRAYLPSNLDLTITAYSFLELPATFLHGTLEPWAEFRVLDQFGQTVATDNFAAAQAGGRVVQEGVLQPGAAATATAPVEIVLQPAQKYLLLADLPTGESPPLTLLLRGPSLDRRYFPLQAEGARAFGPGPDRRGGFALSTSQPTPETVGLQLRSDDPTQPPPIVPFRVIEVDEETLPVRLKSLLPLRVAVAATSAEAYLETPRRYSPGYTATVNGRLVRAVRSPEGNVMVPLRAGANDVELRATGGSRLHAAFWASVSAWVVLGCGAVAVRLRRRKPRVHPALRLLAVVTSALLVGLGYTRATVTSVRPPPAGAGPLMMQLMLPTDQMGRSQAILSSGQPSQGNLVYLRYVDAEHVQVILDVWGRAVTSEAMRVDFQQPVTVTLDAGFLYPADEPAISQLNAELLGQLRGHVRIDLNGQTVLEEPWETFASDWQDVRFGESRIGGSSGEPVFTGRILALERLPIPQLLGLRHYEQGLRVRWPHGRTGRTEPVLSLLHGDGESELYSVQYRPGNRFVLGYDGSERERWQSAELAMTPGIWHNLRWRRAEDDLQWAYDGQTVLTLPGWARARATPPMAWVGKDVTNTPQVEAYFTGELAPLSVDRDARQGGIRLVLRFPTERTGRAEPLVISGETGRADLFYVRYEDDEHVRFGLDHWGVGGAQSEPIALDLTEEHEVILEMGSLYPPVGDARWGSTPRAEQENLRQRLSVRLNGRVVWQTEQATYDVATDQLAFGTNAIGASTAEPAFLGELQQVDRLGLPGATP